MKQVYYTHATVNTWLHNIMREMARDNWKPDYVVGLTRGGLVPAVMLSHYLSVPMNTLKVSLRDDGDTESNLWMAEDALGHMTEEEQILAAAMCCPKERTKILIVDDINDTGSTLQWIKDDWQSSCMPNNPDWGSVWGNNVRVAVMVNNEASAFTADYAGININKNEEPQWSVFPWEEWWDSRIN